MLTFNRRKTMPQLRSEKFHGYVNHLAMLDTGKTVKILGGEGLKLFVKDLDGNVQECYHSNIRLIWDK
jgi:hypothetical protein